MATMLTGTFLRSLDEKQRLAIPKRVRDALGFPRTSIMYVSPGTDGSLAIYAEESFSSVAEKLSRSPPTGADVRAFSRLFYAQSQRVEFDRQGRLRIPAELAELASLTKDVVLLGVGDHLEIWDRDRWEEYLNDKRGHYDEIAEGAFGYGVASQPMHVESTTVNNEEITQPHQPR